MAARLLTFDRTAVPADIGVPADGKLISGTPTTQTWTIEDDGSGLYAGIWEATPGEWHIDYSEWEFFHILEGISVVTEDGGEATTLRAGDSFVIRPGFKGRWRVVETTLKHYVVKV